MNEDEIPVLFSMVERPTPRLGPGQRVGPAQRVDRGPVKPPAGAPKSADKTGGRHAAITNKINNWRSYKEWTEKVRGSWDEKK
jgi:hypothetical protein